MLLKMLVRLQDNTIVFRMKHAGGLPSVKLAITKRFLFHIILRKFMISGLWGRKIIVFRWTLCYTSRWFMPIQIISLAIKEHWCANLFSAHMKPTYVLQNILWVHILFAYLFTICMKESKSVIS